jgi:hypothetical protein
MLALKTFSRLDAGIGGHVAVSNFVLSFVPYSSFVHWFMIPRVQLVISDRVFMYGSSWVLDFSFLMCLSLILSEPFF